MVPKCKYSNMIKRSNVVNVSKGSPLVPHNTQEPTCIMYNGWSVLWGVVHLCIFVHLNICSLPIKESAAFKPCN